MKKSCDGCRALELTAYYQCSLGYAMRTIMTTYGARIPKPLEQCPKPRTIKQYFEEKKDGIDSSVVEEVNG